ncbi:hypothetical protein KUCAC02_001232, partial [Chaenocephalus aceratus]
QATGKLGSPITAHTGGRGPRAHGFDMAWPQEGEHYTFNYMVGVEGGSGRRGL